MEQHISPDGLWRWDGTQWVPNSAPETDQVRPTWKTVGIVAASVGASLVLLAAISTTWRGTEATPTSAAAPRSAPTPRSTPTPEPASTPEGSHESSCDYLLDFDSGHEFVADAFITDEAGVPFTAEVVATWRQAGGTNVVKRKTVHVEPGAQDVQVSFRAAASDRQIDRIQALDTDKQCKVTVTIVTGD